MVLWTDTPISAVELCGSFRVFFGLFDASLINALHALSVSFGGQHSLGRFVVVPYYFNFLIMDLMVLCGMFKVSGIFFIAQPCSVLLHNFVPDLFGKLLGLHGAACLVVRLAWWCALLSDVADSGAFQNRCIYTEIM